MTISPLLGDSWAAITVFIDAIESSSRNGDLSMAVPAGRDMHQIDGGIGKDIAIVRIERGDAVLGADLGQARRVTILHRSQFEARHADNHTAVDFAKPADANHTNFQSCHDTYPLPAVLHISAINGHKRW